MTAPRMPCHRQGFSLVELSIVVAILAVVATLGLDAASSYANRSAYTVTQQRVAVVDKAVDDFFRVNGRLPCPADQGDSATAATYGKELSACLTGGNIVAGVAKGIVPFATLNLPEATALDMYGDRLRFFVAPGLTVSATFEATPAAIEIRTGQLGSTCRDSTQNCSVLADPTDTPPTGAAYAILSHGADRRGALTRVGSAAMDCVPSADFKSAPDAVNCQIDLAGNSLAITGIGKNVFYDNRFNNGSNYANYFDDIIVWRRKDAL